MDEAAVEALFQQSDSMKDASLRRCECGNLVAVKMPCLCSKCQKPHAYWKDLTGNVHALEAMPVAHLANIVRVLGERAEKYPQGILRTQIEIAMDLVYAEISSRDQELKQDAGIQAALTRSLARKCSDV